MNRSLVQNFLKEIALEIGLSFEKGRIEELNSTKASFPLCWLLPIITESELLSSGIYNITLKCDVVFFDLALKGADKTKDTDNTRILFLDDKVNTFILKIGGVIGDDNNSEITGIRTVEYPSYNVSGNVTSAILLSFNIKSNLTLDYCG